MMAKRNSRLKFCGDTKSLRRFGKMKMDFKKLCDYSIGMPEKFEKKINYVLAGNGGVEIRENEIGIFSAVTKKVPGLDFVKEGLLMKLPKIPLPILFQVISFFKDVNKEYGSEAIVQIYWDRQKKEYFCFCPRQEVGGASVDFKRDKEKEKKYLLVADVHSHDEMSAFFSGTDDRDEKETRLFGVVGNIKDPLPDIQFRAVSGNGSVEVSLEDIFETRQEYPKSWFKQIKLKEFKFDKDYPRVQGNLWPDKELDRLNAHSSRKIKVTSDIENLKSQIFNTLRKDEIEWLIEELSFNVDDP
jgi:PRTRC genetic system protein A